MRQVLGPRALHLAQLVSAGPGLELANLVEVGSGENADLLGEGILHLAAPPLR